MGRIYLFFFIWFLWQNSILLISLYHYYFSLLRYCFVCFKIFQTLWDLMVKNNITTLTSFFFLLLTLHLPIGVTCWCLSQRVGKLLMVQIKQVLFSGEGGGASQYDWRLEENTGRPEQGAVGEGAALMWDSGVKDQGAFGPHGALVFEAVAAVPSTGGAVASLLTVGVAVVIAAVLDVSRTESHDGEGWRDGRKKTGNYKIISTNGVLGDFLFAQSSEQRQRDVWMSNYYF